MKNFIQIHSYFVQMNVLFRYMSQPFVIETSSFLKTLQISMRLKGIRRLLWKKTFFLIETFTGLGHEKFLNFLLWQSNNIIAEH